MCSATKYFQVFKMLNTRNKIYEIFLILILDKIFYLKYICKQSTSSVVISSTIGLEIKLYKNIVLQGLYQIELSGLYF